MTSSDKGFRIGLCLAVFAAVALQLWAYWPGVMVWDSIHQYERALDGHYSDWHPPAFEWLWRQLIPIEAGPSPMILLQTGLYWGGLALLAAWALRAGRRGLAVALVACGLLPLGIALIQVVLKDSLLAGLLVFATGLLAWRQARGPAWLSVIALLLLLFGATLRFNALPAILPLAVALLPAAWRRTPGRLTLVTILAAIPIALAMPLTNAMLKAHKSGVELSLIIFDMGGITKYSGVDAFPPLPGVDDPVKVATGCSNSVDWDRFSWWVEDPCEISFDLVRKSFADNHIAPTRWWLSQIAAHPFAYAAHRLAHFNTNTRFLIDHEPMAPVFDQTDPNPWGFHVEPHRLRGVIHQIVLVLDKTPIGWPAMWMALAVAVLALGTRLPSWPLLVPLALSSLLYGLGYLAVSVASEMRYHLWTILAALIATVIALADLRTVRIERRRLVAAFAPAAFVAVLGIIWRLA